MSLASQQPGQKRSLRILLVNDDGPPAPNSPHILSLYQTLRYRGHNVSVVIPTSQRSWGAMAFSISGETCVWWYYPRENDSFNQDLRSRWESKRRPVKEGEVGEWVLVDGSPTTCANIGLFNQALLNPDAKADDTFELVLSGPNFGRNTGAAFCLSSGTLGAALAASLSGVRAVALSYGHFSVVPKAIQQNIDEITARAARTSLETPASTQPASSDPAQQSALKQEAKEEQDNKSKVPSSPTSCKPKECKNVAPVAPKELVQIAHDLSVDIAERLFTEWHPSVGVYNVNVPLAWTLKEPQVYWTTTWRNAYPQLFKPVLAAGYLQQPDNSALAPTAGHPQPPRTRLFFQPEISSMMTESSDQNLAGTDTWALMNGHVSITPLRAGFIEPVAATFSDGDIEAKRWRL